MVTVLLVLSIVTDVATIVAEVDQLGVLGELERGVDVSFEKVSASDDLLAGTSLAQLVVYVASVIAFLVWFYRAYRNLPAFGIREPRFGSGWSIGGWFVPFLNLVRPKQIADDIWRATAPGATAEGDDWRSYSKRSVSPLLHFWWAAWLVASIGGNVAGRLYRDSASISSQQNATYAGIVADCLNIVAAVLAVLVVRAITRRYEERRTELTI